MRFQFLSKNLKQFYIQLRRQQQNHSAIISDIITKVLVIDAICVEVSGSFANLFEGHGAEETETGLTACRKLHLSP